MNLSFVDLSDSQDLHKRRYQCPDSSLTSALIYGWVRVYTLVTQSLLIFLMVYRGETFRAHRLSPSRSPFPRPGH